MAWFAACPLSWALMVWLGFRVARSSPWLLGLFILVPALFVPCLWAVALWLGYPGCSGHSAARGFFSWFALYGLEMLLVLHVIAIVLSPGRRGNLVPYAAASILAYLVSAIPLALAVSCSAFA